MEKLFPNDVVIQTNNFGVHQDWETPIPAFFIIDTPKPHRSIADFTEAEAVEFIRLAQLVRKGMNEVLNIKDVYFFQNEDTDHNFHLWIFPRHNWMEEFGRKIQSVRIITEHAKSNMVNDQVFQEVKQAVSLMKNFMNLNWKN